ncbi:MAG: Hpt domain-containing protein [Betaproteobacteria bacterium]|nr:Hpt domain-containing protein [Betaproteobacteria bacterium]
MGGASSTILSWITTEVDQALSLVREHIGRHTAGDATALKTCPEHMHQVSGALRMVGLAGATCFSEAIEGGFAFLSGARPNPAAIGVIDRAVLALKEYVDGLERGQANVPLRLYPMYRELSDLQGVRDASERDLFFPDLSLQAPLHPGTRMLRAEELKPFLHAQRSLFERGLLALLRGRGGVPDMRNALDALHMIATQLPEPRALWWVAPGLVEALGEPTDADWLARAKVLCNKIDFQMRDLAAGAPAASELLLRDVLYAIAKCEPATPRIREIKQLYLLDSLFAEPQQEDVVRFDMDWLQPALSDVRSRLEALKSLWLQYVSGEPKSAVRFRELVGSFKQRSGELGNPHLVRLLDAIALVAAHLPDPYPARDQFMVIEMASAFLLAESVVENFTDPPADIGQQIGIMGGWLLDAAKGKSSGEPPAGLHADLGERIGAMQLRAQVAREIAANLQYVEQVLDSFARDPGNRGALRGLAPYLRQIHGALNVLGFTRAAEIVPVCEKLIDACADPGHDDGDGHDMDWIAEGLSSVGFFLDPCLQGHEPADKAVELFFRRYEKAHAPEEERGLDSTVILPNARPWEPPAAPSALSVGAAAAQPAAPRPQVNEQLLAIYLEEAGEVLAAVDEALTLCREQPLDKEALTTIRRGFHTLKGSGRMVGLMDLSEVAWEIEQVMNKWLEQQRPAARELLDLIARASADFADWVEMLRTGGLRGEIDGAAIVARARELKSEAPPAVPELPAVAVETAGATEAQAEPPAAPEFAAQPLPELPADAAPFAREPEPPTAPPAEPEADEVQIGSVRLARSLFDIYMREAAQHAATLDAQCAEWRRNFGSEAPHEFVRAAHTLASSSRTAGFEQVAVLAEALEQWMPHARQTAAADAGMVQVAVANLRAMAEALARREAPAAAPALVQGLHGLIARLRAPAAKPKPVAAVPTPRPQPAEQGGGSEKRVMRDDIDPQLMPIFLEEAQQLLPLIGSDLRDWKASPLDTRVQQSLQRALHTLKGSARMAGAIRLGELTHIMESRIEAAIEADALSPALFSELEEKMDRLSIDLERMAAGPEVLPEPAAPAEGDAEAARVEPPLPSPASMLRINADTLDHLINESGEVSIARSRIEGELRAVKQSIGDLTDSIARLRSQLREVEIQADSQMQSRLSVLEERDRDFDPLEFDRYTRLQELTRLMAESLHDATAIQQALLKNLGETDAALTHQSRISRDVQQELMRMRAVPFSILNERMYRIVRQTTRELDKKAELEIRGSQVELDRSVLERIGAPLEHMLRNALAHGLESPAERAAAGKPEAGRITLALRQESNEIVLTVGDDGAGLDLEGLRRKAEERGLLPPGAAPDVAELTQLIFVSGLSTAEAITELAGRGIGMDVVKNEVTAIGGRIEVETERGQGTTFTIYLPLTLAVTQAVLVRAAGSVLAVPSAMVEQVLRIRSAELGTHISAGEIEFQGRAYPLEGLAQLLGGGAPAAPQGYQSVLLLRSGMQRVALHVDELVGNQEIVVKNIGPQLARVPGVSGATVLADGSIVLIFNPVTLAQRARTTPQRTAAPAPAQPAALPVVMVVDDSLTVRKITGRLLEREGYQVLTAKDGVDALEQIKDVVPAVMLVDIEMPRMDGFDLTRQVRADPRTRHVPIIVISSRTAEKHRSQATQLGVNAFLGKPYVEAELLKRIREFIAAQADAAIAA